MAKRNAALFFIIALFLAKTVFSQGLTEMKPGEGGGPVTGSASGTEAEGAAPALERCDAPLGTMAVAEPQEFTQRALLQFSLPSPTGLIRLLIQQSNCFQVIERGVAMQNILQERRLMQESELKEGSGMGRGQLVTADYVLTPDVVFSQQNAGGIGAAAGIVGSFFGLPGGLIGAVAGGLKFKQAQTSMMVADTRSGVQVAAAQGSAEKADFGLGGLFVGGGAASVLGAYENTAEGKVVSASFLDDWNSVVRGMRGNPALQRAGAAPSQASAAAGTEKKGAPGASFERGDVLVGKIGGVKLFAAPSESSGPVDTLARADQVIFLGKEENGFLNVQGERTSGWADKLFLKKAP
ncbi:MAG: CsgG/HfaB family protein [bacterium]|nr:CsgG/HfaB family protein [bacterium]